MSPVSSCGNTSHLRTVLIVALLIISGSVVLSEGSSVEISRSGAGYDQNPVSIPYFVDHRSSFSSRESIDPDGASYSWEREVLGFPAINKDGHLVFYNMEGNDGTRFSNMATVVNPVDGSIVRTVGHMTYEWNTPVNDPVLDHNGNIVSSFIDFGWSTSYSGNNLARLTMYDSSSGDIVWNASLKDSGTDGNDYNLGWANFITPPIVTYNGEIVFQRASGTADDYVSWHLMKTEPATGATEELHSYKCHPGMASMIPRVDDSSNIYLLYNEAIESNGEYSYEGRKLHKFTSAGIEKWSLEWNGSSEFMIGPEGNIYGIFPGTIGSSTSYHLKCISSSGIVSWEFPEPVDVSGLSVADDGTIYATSGRTLYALDNTGSELWSLEFSGSAGTGFLGRACPNDVDGLLISDLDRVYHIDLDGNLLWIVDIGRTLEDPAKIFISNDGMFYLVEADPQYRLGVGDAYMIDGDSRKKDRNFLAFEMGEGGDFGPWDWGGGGDSTPRPRLAFDTGDDGLTIGELPSDGKSEIRISVFAGDRSGDPLKDIDLVFDEPVGGKIEPVEVRTGSDGWADVTYTSPDIMDFPELAEEIIYVETSDGKARATARIVLNDPGPEFSIDSLETSSPSYELDDEVSVNYTISTRLERTDIITEIKLISPDGHVLESHRMERTLGKSSMLSKEERFKVPTAGGGVYAITLDALNDGSRASERTSFGVGSDLFMESGDVGFEDPVMDGKIINIRLEMTPHLVSNGGIEARTEIWVFGSRSGKLAEVAVDLSGKEDEGFFTEDISFEVGEEIKVVLDPENLIKELDEGNNVVIKSFEGPEIIDLKSRFEGYFLEGVSLQNRYTAVFSDEWKDRVAKVDFSIDGRSIGTDTDGNDGFSVEVEMGDLEADSENDLTVIATSKDGIVSTPFTQQIVMVSSPSWFSSLLDLMKPSWGVNTFERGDSSGKFEVSFTLVFKNGANINVPLPLIGGRFGGEMGVTLDFRFSSEGKITLELPVEVGVEIASKESRIKIALSTDVQIINQGHFTWKMLNAKISGQFEMDFPVGPQIKWNKFGLSIDIGVAIVPSLKLDLELKPVLPSEEPDFGSFSATGSMEVKTAVKPKGETDVKLGKVSVEGEGYANMKFGFGPFDVNEVEVGIGAKAEFEAGWFKRSYQYTGSFKYPSTRAENETMELVSEGPIERADTEYPSTIEKEADGTSLVAEDVFSNNKPFDLGNRLFWVHDDISKDQPNGYEIYSRNVISGAVESITDDNIPDLDPKAVGIPGGSLVVWRSYMNDDLHPDSDPLDPGSEISLRYSIQNGSGWSEPSVIEGVLGFIETFDLKQARSGDIFLVALSDMDGNISTEGDESILSLKWNSTGWSDLGLLAGNISVICGPVVTRSLSSIDGQVFVHWIEDLDGNASDDYNRTIVGTMYREAEWQDIMTYASGTSPQMDVGLMRYVNHGGKNIYRPTFSLVSGDHVLVRSDYRNIDVPVPGRALSSWIWDIDESGLSIAVLTVDGNGDQRMIYNRIPWTFSTEEEHVHVQIWKDVPGNVSSPSIHKGMISPMTYLGDTGDNVQMRRYDLNLTPEISILRAYPISSDGSSMIYIPGERGKVEITLKGRYVRHDTRVDVKMVNSRNITGRIGWKSILVSPGINTYEFYQYDGNEGMDRIDFNDTHYVLMEDVMSLEDIVTGVNAVAINITTGGSDIHLINEPYFDPSTDEVVVSVKNIGTNSSHTASLHLMKDYWNSIRQYYLESYGSPGQRVHNYINGMRDHEMVSLDIGPLEGGATRTIRIPTDREDLMSYMTVEIFQPDMFLSRNHSLEIAAGVDLVVMDPLIISEDGEMRLQVSVRNKGLLDSEQNLTVTLLDGNRSVIFEVMGEIESMSTGTYMVPLGGIDRGMIMIQSFPVDEPDLHLSDNSMIRSVDGMLRPDMIVKEVARKDDQVIVTVQNNGVAIAQYVTIETYDLDSGNLLIDTRVISELGVGETFKISVPLAHLRSGNISVLIDRNDTLDELDESNNQIRKTISLDVDGNVPGSLPSSGNQTTGGSSSVGNLLFLCFGFAGVVSLIFLVIIVLMVSRKKKANKDVETGESHNDKGPVEIRNVEE